VFEREKTFDGLDRAVTVIRRHKQKFEKIVQFRTTAGSTARMRRCEGPTIGMSLAVYTKMLALAVIRSPVVQNITIRYTVKLSP
jgi:hypothetical protein